MSLSIFHFKNQRGRQTNLSNVKDTSASKNIRSIQPQQTIRSLIHSIELYRPINMYQNRNNISQSQRHSFFISNRLINFSSNHKIRLPISCMRTSSNPNAICPYSFCMVIQRPNLLMYFLNKNRVSLKTKFYGVRLLHAYGMDINGCVHVLTRK